MKNIIFAWDRFWFAKVDLYWVGLFRCLLACTLFVMYFIRFIDRDILLYEHGLMSAKLAAEYLPEFYQSSLRWIPSTDRAVFAINIFYLAGLLLLAFGLLGRGFCWLLLFLHLSLIHRNFTVIYGPELMASFWLFYLGFIASDKNFSLKNCFRARRFYFSIFVGSKGVFRNDLFSSVGVRLLQVQLCVIYAYTGLEKLKGAAWWNGSAVWHVLGNAQLAPYDFSFFARLPFVIGCLTFATILFEIYFPVVVWIPKVQRYWLVFGTLMHVGVAFLMDLPFFSLVMIAAYVNFLTPFENKR